MKVKSLINFPNNIHCKGHGAGVMEGKTYEVVDESHFPKRVGVMSEDKNGLTWLSADYRGVKEFEVID